MVSCSRWWIMHQKSTVFMYFACLRENAKRCICIRYKFSVQFDHGDEYLHFETSLQDYYSKTTYFIYLCDFKQNHLYLIVFWLCWGYYCTITLMILRCLCVEGSGGAGDDPGEDIYGTYVGGKCLGWNDNWLFQNAGILVINCSIP